MNRLQFSVKKRKIEVVYGCFESDKYLSTRDLISAFKDLLNKNEWIIVLGDSNLIPAREIISSTALYAINAYLSRKMISKWLEIEFLLYLFGTRNISEALRIANNESTRDIGLILVAINSEKNHEAELYSLARLFSLEEKKCGNWQERYAKIYGVEPLEYKKLVGVARAKAALLALSV